jgi:hypothetical protein
MAYFHCLIGGGSSGGGYELTVTCDDDFAGTTITCTDGVTTLTQTCPSSSPYEVVFTIPNGGEWTVSGVIGSASYSASVDIPDSLELHSVPEGSTVLPTDDIQTWLKCAGITDKSYTTLNEVLADSTTLLALMSDNNAVDYLARSTTWASGLTADSTAMTDIGANNYCANTLLSDSTWLNAICNSTYFESVLNVKVPTMTSNTTPSGKVTYSQATTYTSNPAWMAFDNNDSTYCAFEQTSYVSNYLGYVFTDSKRIKKAVVKIDSTQVSRVSRLKITCASQEGGTWVDATDWATPNADNTFVINDNLNYPYWAMYWDRANANPFGIITIQFYGREDV